MATGSVGGFDPTTAQPFDPSTAKPASHGAPNLKHAVKQVDRKVGGALVWAHNHPFDAFMNVAGAPQRGLQAAELGENPFAAMMNPKSAPHLEQALRQPMAPDSNPLAALSPFHTLRQIGAGIGQAEQGPLAGAGLPQKIGRGVLDTAYDVINDPVSLLPVGRIARAIPGVSKVAVRVGEMLERGPIGKVFHPEHAIAGFTDHGRATILSAINLARDASKHALDEAETFIARNADAIRRGDAETAAEAFGIPGSRNPQEFMSAVRKAQAAKTAKAIAKRLRMVGLLPSTAKGAIKIPPEELAQFYKQPANAQAMKAAQTALTQFIKPDTPSNNVILKGLRAATHLGNQAFLAVPVPHAFNLVDLAQQRYGIPTAIKGVWNAARVAAGKTGGKLGEQIAELERTGAKSQYGKLFTEIGFGGRLGKIANTVAVPFQRASNALQHGVLNNLETGLRTAALGAEQKAGREGVDAARMIHQAFGTDPANALVKASSELAQPFAKFHFQTVIANGARTLAENPRRIINIVKAQRDMNKQINPGSSAQFTPTVPSLSFVRAMSSPLTYGAQMGGPLTTLYQGYGALSQVQKGKVAEALAKALGRYVPASQVTDVLFRLATGEKGEGGESPSADILPVFTGGYYSKPKP